MRNLVVMVSAVFCLSVALASVRTVSISQANRDAGNNIVSFDIAFGDAAEGEIDTLYLAYGMSNGGNDLSGWDHVDVKRRVVADESSCTVSAPAGIGTDFSHVRAFLVSGFQPPYDTRLDTVKSAKGYIDTLWMPDQDTRVWADVEVTGWSEYWFGCWGNSYNNKAFAFRGSGSNNYYNGLGNGFRGNQNYQRCMGRHILTLNEPLPSGGRGVSITPVDPTMAAYATNWTYAASTFSTDVTMYLFGFHAVAAFQSEDAVTIRRFKMFEGDALVRDFVPCVKDGVAKMYDALNCQFYGFSGGTQTKGAEVAAADDDLVAASTGGQSASETLAYVKYAVTATVVPARAGRVVEGAVQSVDSGTVPKPFRVMPVSAAVSFVGWRLAGTERILGTELVYQPAVVSEAVAYEAVFEAPEDVGGFVARYDSAAADGGDGMSWSSALNSIDAALDLAQTFGDGEVWVKGGTHVLSKGFALRNNVAVRGGFAGVDGAYATQAEELAARDFSAHESVLSGGGRVTRLIDQQTTADETAVVDGVTFTEANAYAVYVSGNPADYSSPVFSNCTFRGKAAFWMNSRWSQATFANCTFRALEGGSYGRVFFESSGGGTVRLTDCLVECVTNVGYGAFNFSGQPAVFERCRLLRNVTRSDSSSASIAGRASTVDFYDCQLLWNEALTYGKPLTRFRTMVGCVVASNTVTRTGTSTSEVGLLHMTGSTCCRTSIYDNTVIVDEPTVTAGTVWADIFSFASNPSKAVIVDCTIARNVCSVTLGEGAMAQSAVIGYPAGKFGGIVNCTFAGNRMQTADVVDRGFTTQQVPLVNDIFWSGDADYMPFGATTPGNKGFDIRNTIARNTASEADPQFAPKPVFDALGRLAYPVRKPGPAAGRGRALDVTVGGNLCFAIGNDSAWSGGDPTVPVTLTADVFGGVRESGRFNLGSTQLVVASGLTIVFC